MTPTPSRALVQQWHYPESCHHHSDVRTTTRLTFNPLSQFNSIPLCDLYLSALSNPPFSSSLIAPLSFPSLLILFLFPSCLLHLL